MRSLLTQGRQHREFLVEIHPERLARLGCTVDDVLSPFRDAGFHAYFIENDDDPAAYLIPTAPRRLHPLRDPILRDTNVAFSRTNVDAP